MSALALALNMLISMVAPAEADVAGAIASYREAIDINHERSLMEHGGEGWVTKPARLEELASRGRSRPDSTGD